MKIKKILLSVAFLSISFFSNAQEKEIEIKDDKVLLNGNIILKYEKINILQHSFYSLDDNEILMYKYNNNETKDYSDDDYIVLNFLTAKKKVESKDIRKSISGIGLNSRKNMEKLVVWLLKEKVINETGEIDLSKLETFYEKYNENITERTIR